MLEVESLLLVLSLTNKETETEKRDSPKVTSVGVEQLGRVSWHGIPCTSGLRFQGCRHHSRPNLEVAVEGWASGPAIWGTLKDRNTAAWRGERPTWGQRAASDSNPLRTEPAGGPGSGPTTPAAISAHSLRVAPAPGLPLSPPRSHLRPSLRSAPIQLRARLRSCPGSAPPPPPRPAPATAAAAAAILGSRRLNNNFIDKRSHRAGPEAEPADWGRGLQGKGRDAFRGGASSRFLGGAGLRGAELTFVLLPWGRVGVAGDP